MLSVDWSFLDAAYMITCQGKEGSNERLERAMTALEQVGLANLTEVREFPRDDSDRIRGCYTSHISVLQEVAARFKGKDKLSVLVLEDNLSISPRLSQPTLDAVADFVGASGGDVRCDMLHLAYIMYVPGLYVERLDGRENILQLHCSPDSVLGTTAYIVTRSGLDAIIAEHEATGYVDAIPNMMARLFPESRYAAYPMPMHRAATVKSLVNGQLDDLRALLFQPQAFTLWERLLVGTGQPTNVIFPACVTVTLVVALASLAEAGSAILAQSRGESSNLLLAGVSTLLSSACLLVFWTGLSLAPKPQPQEPPTPQESRG